MNTKLTLSLDKDIIEQAKSYAKTHKVSLSSLIENYLQKLLADYQDKVYEKASIVNELSGIIQLDTEEDYKDAHTDYLTKKYS